MPQVVEPLSLRGAALRTICHEFELICYGVSRWVLALCCLKTLKSKSSPFFVRHSTQYRAFLKSGAYLKHQQRPPLRCHFLGLSSIAHRENLQAASCARLHWVGVWGVSWAGLHPARSPRCHPTADGRVSTSFHSEVGTRDGSYKEGCHIHLSSLHLWEQSHTYNKSVFLAARCPWRSSCWWNESTTCTLLSSPAARCCP